MFKHIVDRVSRALTTTTDKAPNPAEREHAIRMATAVLMVDVARADSDFQESEFDLLLELIKHQFTLSGEEANALANAAHEEAEELVEISRFTQHLHDSLSEDEKLNVVGLLWKIAFADGRLSKHEDALVLKISDLLYVNRAKVMRLKHDAQESATDA